MGKSLLLNLDTIGGLRPLGILDDHHVEGVLGEEERTIRGLLALDFEDN